MTNESFPPTGYIATTSKVSGIEVYMPAPPDAAPQPEIVDFKCPQCGATTAYSAADGGLTCSHCGYYEAPSKPVVGRKAAEFEFTVETLERDAQGWGETRKELACQNCGALTSIASDSLTHTCPFCGSNQVIQRQAAQDMLRPRFLIPFKLESEACQKIARDWLGSSWMVPSSLKGLANIASFQGLFLPFWTFDAQTRADWKAEVGHPETERYYDNGQWKTRTVIRWRWESGHAELPIEDLLVCGSNRVSVHILDQIKGFDLSQLALYEPKYLAGLGAKSYDVPLEKAWETARQAMRENTRQACVSQASTSMVRNFSMNLDYANEGWRYILLPVYMASYRYGDKSYQVMVNAQTGQIGGQRPADWNKIWLIIAALLALGLILGVIGLLTIPLGGAGLGIGGVGFILLVIGLIIGVVIYQKAQALDEI